MNIYRFASRISQFGMLGLVFVLTACGSKLEGTYTPTGEGLGGIIQSILIKSGGKVEVTGMGMTKEGTYEVEGNKVKLTISGDTTIFTLDDNGCLDGGGMIGKFCKTETASSSKSPTKAAKNGAPSGVYESKMPDGTTFTIEFMSGGKAKMTMTENGTPDVTDANWSMNGGDVMIQATNGPPVNLERKGDGFVANMGGVSMTFVKK